MKLYLFISIFTFEVWADEFSISPLRKGIKFETVNGLKEKKYNPLPQERYLNPNNRDLILKKHLANEVLDMEEFEKDMLYKKLIHYSSESLLEIYPFLTLRKINEIRIDL